MQMAYGAPHALACSMLFIPLSHARPAQPAQTMPCMASDCLHLCIGGLHRSGLAGPIGHPSALILHSIALVMGGPMQLMQLMHQCASPSIGSACFALPRTSLAMGMLTEGRM